MSWRSEADRVGRDCTRRNQALLFSSSFSGKAEKLGPPEAEQPRDKFTISDTMYLKL